MRLESLTLKNFRCYRDEVTVNFGDLTTFVGKNDIGKSTVLEALEIFFNNETVKIEQGDSNVYNQDETKVSITCEFSDLPSTLSLDAGASTTLADEYLLTTSGTLKIRKVFECRQKTPSLEIFILALHPTAPGVDDLLELKEKDLQARIKAKQLVVGLKGNPGMRRALWQSETDLRLDDVLLPLTKSKEDGKRIWEQLEGHLPLFALFQSDRSSRDSDGEVQTPMKAAVAAAIAELQDEISRIQKTVEEKAVAIAQSTLTALRAIDPSLAKELTPQFTPPSTSKWTGMFTVTMDTDDGIPLNKRGSGIRRLILVSFFKAAAERRLASGTGHRSIIYAIEEPETAQHPNYQKILIESFKSLSESAGCQVMLSTHSPGFACELPSDSIRYISRDAMGLPTIAAGVDIFETVATALGVVADSRIKVLLCVEGPTDVPALKALSRALHLADSAFPDLTTDRRVAFVPMGGSTLQHWVTGHYLRGLGRPEVHIYDSDVSSYANSVSQVNSRTDGSWATQTQKHEIESYLHPDAIADAFGVHIEVPDKLSRTGQAVPSLFAQAVHAANPVGAPMGDTNAKKRLSAKAFPLMTAERIDARDPTGEVRGWFRRLAGML